MMIKIETFEKTRGFGVRVVDEAGELVEEVEKTFPHEAAAKRHVLRMLRDSKQITKNEYRFRLEQLG